MDRKYRPSKVESELPRPYPSQIERWVRGNFTKIRERYSKSKGEKCLLINNPTIPSDSGYHVAIFPKTGRVKDFRPNMRDFNGDVIRFIAMVYDIPWIEAYNMISKEVLPEDFEESPIDFDMDDKPEEDRQTLKIQLPEGFLPISETPSNNLERAAISYLAMRQISAKEAAESQIHYSLGEICFLYFEFLELVYWQIRDIRTKRFQFPAGLNGQEYLYGFDAIEPGSVVCITEANFNTHSIGIGRSLAAGTAEISDTQARKIASLSPSKVILCPDYDAAGIKSIRINAEKLSSFGVSNILVSYPYKGPDTKLGYDWNDVAQETKNPGAIWGTVNKQAFDLSSNLLKIMKVEERFGL